MELPICKSNYVKVPQEILNKAFFKAIALCHWIDCSHGPHYL